MSARFPDAPPRSGAGRKLAIVAAIAAFTTGASGYFMGLRQTERTAARVRESRTISELSHAPASTTRPSAGEAALVALAAPTYAQLSDRTRQANAGWRSDLATLRPAPAFTAETPRLTPSEQLALEARRATRRAYNGAPPVVPHPIDQRQSASCLTCHGQPTRIDRIDVPQMSHAPHSQCLQCHAPMDAPGRTMAVPPPPVAAPAAGNTFAGLGAGDRGTRAHADAPPTVPHSTAMRQNCITCHGPGGSSVIKTTHPQRQNCVQCHALDAARETVPLSRPGGGITPPSPPPSL